MPDIYPPFRWDITRRNQLGSLIKHPEAILHEWVTGQFNKLGIAGYAACKNQDAFRWLLDELTKAASRALELSRQGHLYFVGRSPESFFDYLSGILASTTWRSRLHLLPFSMRTAAKREEIENDHSKRKLLEDHLTSHELHPQHISSREHSTALVDIVDTGATLGNVVTFLHKWSARANVDWRNVRGKLRIIGMTQRTKTSPNTWRWQQHAEWMHLLPVSAGKNISIPIALFHYLGASQSKLTPSFKTDRWQNPGNRLPGRDDDTTMALHLAYTLYTQGTTKSQRRIFALVMNNAHGIKQSWYRSLMHEIKTLSEL